ncbi:MAG: hypothetical protein ACP5G1_00045 [Nanopusillaceae archaeon]
MEEKITNINEEVVKELRSKLATLSTNTLLRYYEDIKSNIIPQNLSTYIQYITFEELLEFIEKELIMRGAFKRIKRIKID